MKFSPSFIKGIHPNRLSGIGLFLLLLVFLWATHTFPSKTNLVHCGLPECKVKCNCRQETHIGCEAIKRARHFFKSYGYEIKTVIDIEFVKNTTGHERDSQNSKSIDKKFLCQYNRKTKCIKISSWIGSPQWDRRAFGVFPLDIEFFTSMVTHEVAHRLFDSILESREETTGQIFHEFIAYTAQIATMKKSHKSKVLALWPKERLPTVDAINSFVWMAEPNKFSVLSYRLFKSNPFIIEQILNGKIKPAEMSFILDY